MLSKVCRLLMSIQVFTLESIFHTCLLLFLHDQRTYIIDVHILCRLTSVFTGSYPVPHQS